MFVYNEIECEMNIPPGQVAKSLTSFITNSDIIEYFQLKYDEVYAFLNATASSQSLVSGLSRVTDCLVYVEAPKNERFYVSIDKLRIHVFQNNSREITPLERVNCTENFMELYDGTTSVLSRVFHFCTEDHRRIIYNAQTNKIFIRYHLAKNTPNDEVSFRLRFNTFTQG
jgi:hypothetical protein